MDRITISSKIDSTFEFEMLADGINLDDSDVRLRIEQSKDIANVIRCNNVKDNMWTVTIPKGLVPNGGYKFTLDVNVDDFHFEPASGKITVVNEKTIKVYGVDQEQPKPKSKPKKKVEESKEIIDEMKTESEETVEDKPKELSEADIKVREILASIKTRGSDENIVENILENADTNIIDRDYDDPNEKVRDILESIAKQKNAPVEDIVNNSDQQVTPTPTIKISTTATVDELSFFEEIENMRTINERRRANKLVRKAIENNKTKT
jgi:hypothetical protein